MPVIVEPRYDIADQEADLARVYADFPGRDADACIGLIRAALGSGGVFYSGIFNGKTVAGALVDGPADARHLQLVAVRAATRRRGVALRLLDEIARLEQRTGAQALLLDADGDTAALLTRRGFAADPRQPGRLRRVLPAATAP